MTLEAVFVLVASLLLLAMFAFMLQRPGTSVALRDEGLLYGKHTMIPWHSVDRLRYVRTGTGARYEVGSGPLRFMFTLDQANAADPDALRRALVSRAQLALETAGGGEEVWVESGVRVEPSPEPPPAPAAEPLPQGKCRKDHRKGLWALIAAVAIALLKFGGLLLKGLKLVGGALKFAKFLPTAISMVVMVVVYAQLFGFWFAAGFVVLIFVHEIGHAVVMWAKGLKTGPIVFLPFLGAFIAIKSQVRSAAVEAEMAYGGPAAGTLAASACYGIYLWNHDIFWLSLAYFGFFLNLFNLIPLSPLDGGRVVTAISTKLWILGLVIAAAFVLYTWNIILLLILILGCARAWKLYRDREHRPDYYTMPPRYRALIATAYFGLCAYLGYMVYHALPVLEAARHLRS